jgi:hypothetical protein
MKEEGPLLEALTRRLAECPADFLAEPRIGKSGAVHVEAVVSDLLRDLGGASLTPAQAAVFQSKDARKDRNRLSLVLIGCWLLHDEWFRKEQRFAAQAHSFLSEGLTELAALVPAPQFASDADRREELVRLCLRQLGLRPGGESESQALDRLTTLNTAERQRVIRAAREAEERARAIREAMAKKAAEEAADKWTRE